MPLPWLRPSLVWAQVSAYSMIPGVDGTLIGGMRVGLGVGRCADGSQKYLRIHGRPLHFERGLAVKPRGWPPFEWATHFEAGGRSLKFPVTWSAAGDANERVALPLLSSYTNAFVTHGVLAWQLATSGLTLDSGGGSPTARSFKGSTYLSGVSRCR